MACRKVVWSYLYSRLSEGTNGLSSAIYDRGMMRSYFVCTIIAKILHISFGDIFWTSWGCCEAFESFLLRKSPLRIRWHFWSIFWSILILHELVAYRKQIPGRKVGIFARRAQYSAVSYVSFVDHRAFSVLLCIATSLIFLTRLCLITLRLHKWWVNIERD